MPHELHAETPGSHVGPGVFFYILVFYRWMLWFKEVVFLRISGCKFGTNVARRPFSDQVWPSLQRCMIHLVPNVLALWKRLVCDFVTARLVQ